MDKNEISKMSLEDTFATIDDVMAKLSSDDLPLEESFSLYKDGMQLINHCNEVIDDVEKQMITLQRVADEADAEDEEE